MDGRGWLRRSGGQVAPLCLSILVVVLGVACGRSERAATPRAQNLILITIDTLRADHVGAYGWAAARTPTLDALARDGAVFERAYAAAPITLPSHATILTGRYPPGHGARDNGIRMSSSVPTLATELRARGFKTAAFVAAFPLDHQFGLGSGFDVYSDHLPRGPGGHLANERPASAVIDEAIAWLKSLGALPALPVSIHYGSRGPTPARERSGRADAASALAAGAPPPGPSFFLWVHLFEPHAPYGDPADTTRTALQRYDDEIATADSQVGRLMKALGILTGDSLIVVAGDHGEAFGEHGEFAHSIFVYDTTLRVPLTMTGAGIRAGTRVEDPVTLADVAPTAMRMLGGSMKDVDGIDLTPTLAGTPLPKRELYAESFATLIEFGWAPLRAIRSGPWKFVAAPTPELYDLDHDAAERTNVAPAHEQLARDLERRVNTYSPTTFGATMASPLDAQTAERLRALGYSSGSRRNETVARPDPKDRRELAARIAQVTSGELTGAALVSALESIAAADPRNGQAHLRLGYARLQAGNCAAAEPEFHAAIASGLPSADAHLGLATCLGRRNDLAGAERALGEARRLEPDNPSVAANLGILKASQGDYAAAIESLKSALAADPDLQEARFNLALVYARWGRRAEAAATARELLARLPSTAAQRAEVERLLRAVQ